MRKEATLQKWKELYDLTLKIKAIEPWKYLADTDIIQIELPTEKEPCFICVIGNNEETYGVITYNGYRSFNSYIELSDALEMGIPSLYAMYEQDNLTCYFGDRKEVSPRQYKIISQLGLNFRGKNQWPYFLSCKPLYTPYLIDRSEVDLLINVYREFIPLLKKITAQEIRADFYRNETVVRFYDKEAKTWKNEVRGLKYSPKSYLSLKIEEKHPIMDQIRSLATNNIVVEIDMNYFNTEIDGKADGYDRPINPKFLILLDKSSGMVIKQEMINPKKKEEEVITDLLFQFIGNYGRPKAIHFRLPVFGYLLEDFCLKIGVPLIHKQKLPASDEFFEDFSTFFKK